MKIMFAHTPAQAIGASRTALTTSAPVISAPMRRVRGGEPAFHTASATAGSTSTPWGFVRHAAAASAPAAAGQPAAAATIAPVAGNAGSVSRYPHTLAQRIAAGLSQ